MYNIKITGSGTSKEIAEALKKLAETIEALSLEELKDAELEDATLMTEISEEE